MILRFLLLFFLASTFACLPKSYGQYSEEFEKENKKFAFEFFQKIYNPKGNTLFSPYSISSCMAMTYSGARNNTLTEMANVMHFTKDNLSVHQGFQRLNKKLKQIDSQGNISLKVANSLWPLDKNNIKSEFFEFINQYYEPSIYPLTTADAVNQWVASQTDGKINHLVTKEDLVDTKLLLINAIYFNGGWESVFKEEKTHKEAFFTYDDNKKVEVDMMYQELKTIFIRRPTFDMVALPYKNKEMSMYIILPHEGFTIPQVIEDAAKLLENSLIFSDFCCEERKVKLSLPKFKIETPTMKLNDILMGMGIKDAFISGKADFSGMSSLLLFIDSIFHKCFIEVNEKGSIAAASTVVNMQERSAEPEEVEMKVNRPFLFLISDTFCNDILFLGSVTNPLLK